ncbi:MAG: methyltransferase domain-containing protein [Thermodesulfobacteriota bacterium]|nr:methyltransferase domain-containing protein [Thermodesulfobacteriota bacterium]
MEKTTSASMEFSLVWNSKQANHRDRYFIKKVNFRSDIFPGDMEQKIMALHEGETCSEDFDSGVLVPPYEDRKILKFKETKFEKTQGTQTIIPRIGRFYPQGFAWTALNCFQGNRIPFRVADMSNGIMVADTNHPLANYPLTLDAKCLEKLVSMKGHGRECKDITEMVTENGPGMQIPYPGIATDFYSVYPFQRKDESDDILFYKSPRLINHLDNTAIGQVKSIHSRLLSSGSKILDLMSSWVSHLPDTLEDYVAVGLGMNEEELKANQQLSSHVVHDLNKNPVLPFQDNEFDAVICTVSIEYLTQPIEVIAEVDRVTKKGGVFVTTISDRWFPGKEILHWDDMHHFERLGFVLDLYIKAGAFHHLHTESIRGLPRPLDDPHIEETTISDPIFVVWGNVKG